MDRWIGTGALVLTSLLSWAGQAASAQTQVVFTADVAGAMGACASCDAAKGEGGADRWVAASQRAGAAPDSVWVDGGGFLFGGADPGIVVRAYAELPFAAIHVAPTDFRLGLDFTQDLLGAAALPVTSANLTDASGKLLFAPFVVTSGSDGAPVAIIGVSEAPRALKYLPSLAAQLEGVVIADPLESLRRVLPEAEAAADEVILLTHGSARFTASLHEEFGPRVIAVGCGGARPPELAGKAPSATPLLSVRARGVELAHLGADGVSVLRIRVADGEEGALARDPRVAAVVAGVDPEAAAAPSPSAEPVAGFASDEPGAGRGLRLTTGVPVVVNEIEGLSAGPGMVWATVDIEVENDIPLDLAFGGEREAGEKVLVALKQNLFLVHGAAPSEQGATVTAIPAAEYKGADALPTSFHLMATGSRGSGTVAFPWPKDSDLDGVETLALWLDHDEFSPAIATIRGELAPLPPPPGASSNGYVCLHSASLREAAPGGLSQPPAGQRWVEVALEGSSDWAPFDGRHKPATYLRAFEHLQLVVDGQWAYGREPGKGTLPGEPVFLPGYRSGGTAYFLVPEDARQVALALYFPLLQGTGLGAPAPLVLDLEGESVGPIVEPALAAVDDDPVDMAILGVERLAADGPLARVELDVRFINRGADGGEFDVSGRFLGEGYRFVGTFDPAGVPLAERPVLPAGERRAMRLRLDVPEAAITSADEITVGYAGITLNPTLTLALGAEATVGEATVIAEEMGSAQPPAWAEAGALKPDGDSAAPAGGEEREIPLGDPLPAAENDALQLTVLGARIVSELPGASVPKGAKLLVIDTRWQIKEAPNVDQYGQIKPETWNLAEALYLVVGDRRIAPRVHRGEGLLSERLEVPSKAARRAFAEAFKKEEATEVPLELEGRLAFVLSDDVAGSFALHFLDPASGNFVVPLGERTVPDAAAPYPAAVSRVARIRVHGLTIDPPGPRQARSMVRVDLRGTSLRRAEPRSYGGRSEPIAHSLFAAKTGAVHLLIDGEVPVVSTSNDLAKRSPWLPSAETGGVYGFAVSPEVLNGAKSVELVVCLGDTSMPGEAIHRPEPLVVPLLGGADARASRLTDVWWELVDDSLEVSGGPVPTAEGRDPGADFELRLRFRNLGRTLAQVDLSQLLGAELPKGKVLGARSKGPKTPLAFGAQQMLFVPGGAVRTIDIAIPQPPEMRALRYRGLLRSLELPRAAGELLQAPPRPPVDGVSAVDRARPLGGIAAVGLKGQDVNRAIERGRDWMLGEIASRFENREVPYFYNRDLPMLLALVHAGAHDEFPDFAEQLDVYLRQQRPGAYTSQNTYRCGLLAMLLDSLGDPAHDVLLRDVATYLVNAQTRNGTWPYAAELPAWLFVLGAAASDGEGDAEWQGPLRVTGAAKGPESTAPSVGPSDDDDALRRTVAWTDKSGDNSIAQYALLGLHACENAGVEIDPEVWRRALRTLWKRQAMTGGWAYTSGSAYGSMTCAGVGATALSMRALESDRDPVLDARVYAGCAWLADRWRIDKNPDEDDGWEKHIYYHYYGVERAGRLLDSEFFGRHEWYPIIAKELVGAQSNDGSWPGSSGEKIEHATAFAILFLTRATETLDPVAREAARVAREAQRPTTGRLEMKVEVQEGRGAVVVLDASGSMLAPPAGAPKRGSAPKFEHAREAVMRVVERLPEGAPAGLVVYGHRRRARDKDADSDVELVVPVGALDRAKFGAAVSGLRARGKTPLALALKESVKALKAARIRAGTIILLTDGGQGREPGDPVAAAKALGQAGYSLEIVAFDMDGRRSKTVAAWNDQIESMAAAAEGRWVSVEEGARLAPVLLAAATGEPGLCEIIDGAGEVVYTGAFRGTVDLDPGAYVVRASFGLESFEAGVEISRGRTARIEFDGSRAGR